MRGRWAVEGCGLSGAERVVLALRARLDLLSKGGAACEHAPLVQDNAQTGGRHGCAIRTDSASVVYVVWEGTDTKTGQSVFFLARSFDGGSNFDKAQEIATVHDVGVLDPVSGRIVFDGFVGTRTDSFPSLSIATAPGTTASATAAVRGRRRGG